MAGPYRALALLDRDGTLIEERHYLSDPIEVVLLPRAARAIRLLHEQGIAAVVCTNQSGVARGYFSEADVEAVHRRMEELLAGEGARLDAILTCPAHEDAVEARFREGLDRRKPAPGMAREAQALLGLEDAPVFAIGDKLIDGEFGRAAGGEGLLVRTGHGARLTASEIGGWPVFADVYDAVSAVVNALILKTFPEDAVLARKLRTPGQLRGVAEGLRSAGKTSVLANGCFDILHGGHISFLESAKDQADALILAVNSNASIGRLKGEGRPLLAEPERLQLLAALEAVDYLTVFHPDSADEALEEILPDFHAKGTDYRSDNVPELRTSRRLGIGTIIAGAPKENSTRDVIEVVAERSRAGVL